MAKRSKAADSVKNGGSTSVADECVKPPALRDGDRVAIVSPASRPEGAHVIAAAQKLLGDMNFVPVVGEYALAMHGYMAGTDEERLLDLNRFLHDSSIRGIFCTTGGYGSLRLLNGIDYDALRKDPKVIVGSDENTCLLNAINNAVNLVVFHSWNLDCIDSKEAFDDLRTAITSAKPLAPMSAHANSDFDKDIFAPYPGKAEGRLIGGNLSSFFGLMGTDHEPDFENKILFFEDKNERNDVLERWFTGMELSGQLKKATAVLLGNFKDCGARGSYNILPLEDLFGPPLKELQIPSCFGMPIGQSGNHIRTIPIGIQATFDATPGKLEFLETAISK